MSYSSKAGMPPYVPPPSMGHEIGIMLGFLGAMVVSMLLYGVWWSHENKRFAKQEADRVNKMREQGYMDVKHQSTMDVEPERVERKTMAPKPMPELELF